MKPKPVLVYEGDGAVPRGCRHPSTIAQENAMSKGLDKKKEDKKKPAKTLKEKRADKAAKKAAKS